MRKSGKAGKKVNRFTSVESQDMLIMGSALGEQMMGMLSQVAISRRGMGAAATALAIAVCEGVEVESLFESQVAYWSLTINQ